MIDVWLFIEKRSLDVFLFVFDMRWEKFKLKWFNSVEVRVLIGINVI